MKPRVLKTEADHTRALAKVERLMDAKPGSPQEEELELWSLLVEHYENKHFPIDFPDPVEAIRFRMEQEGLRQKDLTRFLPGKNRASEILSRKRPFTPGMIRSLHHGLGIPATVILQKSRHLKFPRPLSGAPPPPTHRKNPTGPRPHLFPIRPREPVRVRPVLME